jgi:hypothetical protein
MATSDAAAIEKTKQALLIQQTAAILVFLNENDLGQAAEQLKIELCKKFGADFPKQEKLIGHWEWVIDTDASNDEQDESDEDSSSSSGEYETDSNDDKSDEKTSSEYETDSEEESEEEIEKKAEPDIAINKKVDVAPVQLMQNKRGFGRSNSMDIDKPKEITPIRPGGRRGLGRSVSFDDNPPQETILAPVQREERKKLFYSKSQILQFKADKSQEEMEEKMKEAMGTMGLNCRGSY